MNFIIPIPQKRGISEDDWVIVEPNDKIPNSPRSKSAPPIYNNKNLDFKQIIYKLNRRLAELQARYQNKKAVFGNYYHVSFKTLCELKEDVGKELFECYTNEPQKQHIADLFSKIVTGRAGLSPFIPVNVSQNSFFSCKKLNNVQGEYGIAFNWDTPLENIHYRYLVADPIAKFSSVLQLLGSASEQDELEFVKDDRIVRLKKNIKTVSAYDTLISKSYSALQYLTHLSSSDEDISGESSSNNDSAIDALEKFFIRSGTFIKQLLVIKDREKFSKLSWQIYYAYLGLRRIEKHHLDNLEAGKSQQFSSLYASLGKIQSQLAGKNVGEPLTYAEWFQQLYQSCYEACVESHELQDMEWKIRRYSLAIAQLYEAWDTLIPNVQDPKLQEIHSLLAAYNPQTADLNEARNYCMTLFQKIRAVSGNGFEANRLGCFIMTSYDFQDFFIDILNQFDEHIRGCDPWQPQTSKTTDVPLSLPEFDRIHENLANLSDRVTTATAHRVARSIYKGMGNVDSLLDGNIPNIVMRCLATDKTVYSIGFGTPTSESSSVQGRNGPEITAELTAVLETYQTQGKKFLMILRQDVRESETIIEDLVRYAKGNHEVTRGNKIILQEEKYPGTLYVLVCCQDSPFYHQTADYIVEEFKKQLHQEFFVEPMHKSGNLLSEQIKKEYPTIEREAVELIDLIHACIFDKATVLTKEERCAFHDLFTTLLNIKTIFALDVDYFANICRDTSDRSMISTAILYTVLCITYDCLTLPWFAKNFFVILFARALVTLKRKTSSHRVIRCRSTVQILLERRSQVKRLCLELFGDKQLIPQEWITSHDH